MFGELLSYILGMKMTTKKRIKLKCIDSLCRSVLIMTNFVIIFIDDHLPSVQQFTPLDRRVKCLYYIVIK